MIDFLPFSGLFGQTPHIIMCVLGGPYEEIVGLLELRCLFRPKCVDILASPCTINLTTCSHLSPSILMYSDITLPCDLLFDPH